MCVMVNLRNTNEVQTILIPKVSTKGSPRVLILTGQTDNSVHRFEVQDGREFALYYSLDICLPQGVAVGMYDYELQAGPESLGKGVARIAGVIDVIQNGGVIQYGQYNG